MRLLWITQFWLLTVVIFGLSSCNALISKNSTHVVSLIGNGQLKKDSGSGVIGPSYNASQSRRVAKDFLKHFNITLDPVNATSTSEPNQQQKRSPPSLPGVQIIESGQRRRGEARILKRGQPLTGPRSGDSRFSLRNRLRHGGSGYDSGPSSLASSTSVDSLGSFQVISIPGSDIPPPVYSYTGRPSSSVVVASGSPGAPGGSDGAPGALGGTFGDGAPGALGGPFGAGTPGALGGTFGAGAPGASGGTFGSTAGAPGGSGSGGSYGSSYKPYKPGGGGGGFVASTSRPEIIIPPEVVTPTGPKPIGPPGPGTSVPIIGGGGGGGSVLPPSPPPDEIFPPAPPPDEDELDFDVVGRRLKVNFGRDVPIRTKGVTLSSSRATSNSRFPTTDVLRSEHSRNKFGGGGGRKRPFVEEVEGPLISDELVGDDPNIITDFVFSDIRCFKTRQREYFGATIHMKSGFHLPYIRDRPQDPLSAEGAGCRLDPVESTHGSAYHMEVTDFRGCGVEQCGESMCLTMVFPRVLMLALADDEVTTIKCTPQQSTISDTKSISFAGDTLDSRLSSSTVEGGIQEFVAEVGVFRQNPGSTNGLFVKRVSSGGVVQLGEPLQLRSVVRGTDGWKHSRLTDVKVWRMRDNMKQNLDNLDPNQASEVITLVDPQGCRNDEYIVIANDHPIKDPRNDMVHHFTFKAFLFRGQRVNEPLIVTAKVHACQELQDCIMECEGHRGRLKRSPIEHHNASAIVHDFDSQLALRVVGLKDHPSSILDDGQFPFDYPPPVSKSHNKTMEPGSMTCNEKMFATGLGGGCIMLLICGLALALYTYIKQGRIHYGRNKASSSPRGRNAYRYPPPPGRFIPSSGQGSGPAPYQKPLPAPPTSSSQSQQPPTQAPPNNSSNGSNSDGKTMNEMSQVAKLLQELAKNNNNQATGRQSSGSGKSAMKTEPKKKIEQSSEYACIDETSSPGSSSSSSEIDLTRVNKTKKDGVYILYCYNKDKKNKLMLPLSAPSSTRMRRKHLKGKGINDLEEEDDDDGDFICQDEDSETMASQTEEATESDDSYEEAKSSGKPTNNNKNSSASGNNNSGNIAKNQVCRRTVREVKKKSKQNNSIAYSGGGIIRRRVSSIYREGYMSGIRGAVAAAVGSRGGSRGSVPLRYRKSPSTGNIPEAAENDDPADYRQAPPSGKRIHFSVRERRSARKRRQLHQPSSRHYDQYSTSEGMLSEATTVGSDLDSAYSGSNCSKLTEDQLYELKHGRGGSGRYPDFRNFHKHQNLVDVQRQLRRSGAQGHHQQQKQEVRRTSSSPNNGSNNTTNVEIGLGSPPLSLGETKATHFVTRDDSTTKILIVPETHV